MPNADNIDLVESMPGVIVMDLDEHPWDICDDSYDSVFVINSLEHLADPVAAVEEIHRVLRPGGIAVIRTPYWNSPDHLADLTHRRAFGHRSFDLFDDGTTLGADRAYSRVATLRVIRYTPFVHFLGAYVPINRPAIVVRILVGLAERIGRVIWSQEHWLQKPA